MIYLRELQDSLRRQMVHTQLGLWLLFRHILRKVYRQTVATHHGPTRTHQAGYSPRHRRDGIAGTMIRYHLRIYRWTQSLSVMTTGQPGAASAWAAGPFRDYGPDGAADAAAGPMTATAPLRNWTGRRTTLDMYLHMGDRGPAPLVRRK